MLRSVVISVRLAEPEAEAIGRAATAEEVSVSELIRSALLVRVLPQLARGPGPESRDQP